MPDPTYLHGYTRDEQLRLIRQAEHWRDLIILPGLDYRPGDRLLDIGCGAGAVLRVLAGAFPGLHLAGIDIAPAQVEFARQYLQGEGLDADLRVGDASHLPWPDAAFDHVYMMWIVEHVRDALPILREARRVLRPAGTIALAETDYTYFKVNPPSPDWDAVERAQHDHFAKAGNPIAGRQLDALLHRAGFSRIRNSPIALHYASATDPEALRRHAHYMADFLDPAVPALATLGFDEATLRRGIAHLRRLHTLPDGSLSQITYKAIATNTPPP